MTGHKKIGPWTVKSATVPYSNPWIEICHHEVVHPDGSDGIYGVVHYRNFAIGVLPLFDDGTVPLVGQHRFPSDSYSWELPEGGGPLTALPLDSARRELLEETGYSARNWLEFIGFDVSNSVSDERSICFLAWDLVPGQAEPEPSEELAHDRIAFAELVARCLDGRIRDSLTIVMALAVEARRQRGDLPEPVLARLQAGAAA